MKQIRKIFSLIVFMAVLLSCNKEYDRKYAKPDWLVGTVYDQVTTYKGSNNQTGTHLFAEAVDSVGLKGKLSNGAWTFFVPSDSAVRQYLAQKGLSSLLQLPREELTCLVLNHLLKYAYNDYQLLNLNLSGLNLSPDVVSSFSGYQWRFLTQCTDAPGVEKSVSGVIIDTATHEIAGYQKTIPLLSNEYFSNIAKCPASQNYNYFYPNTVWGGLNLASANILKRNIVCDNGYIHVIDKVIEPIPNLRQIIASNPDYSMFYHILSRFATYSINGPATAARPNNGDVNHDGVIDYLYDINYSGLTINPGNTLSNGLNVAYTLCPPSNDVLTQYLNNTALKYYSNIDSVPLSFFKPLVLAHLASSPYWPTQINNLTLNGNGEPMTFDPAADVKTKAIACNGLMYGINKVLVPNYHKSVAGQLIDPSYSVFIKALEISGVLANSLQYLNSNFTVFVPNNKVLADSGIVYDPLMKQLKYPDPVSQLLTPLTGYNLQQFVQNYIVKGKFSNLSDVKYLTTLNNKIIKVVDNQTIQAGGNVENNENVSLTHVDVSVENGDIYLVNKMLKQPKGNLGYYLKTRFPGFFKLMSDAGLISTATGSTVTDYNRYSIGTLLSSSGMATVFAVSDPGVSSFTSLPNLEKENFCRYLMITNINVIPGDYYNSVIFNTQLKDLVNSQPGLTIMTKIKLNTDASKSLYLINNTGNQNVLVTDDLIITSNGVVRAIANDQAIQYESN